MVLKPDQQRVCTMLKDTITLLCKNGLNFKRNFNIEAVIGVTLDNEDMFHISMSQLVKSPTPQPESDSGSSSDVTENENSTRSRKRKKHLSMKREKSQSELSEEEEENGAVESDNESHYAKRPHIKGEQVEEEEDEDSEDIVFVKQEMEDNWSQSHLTENNQNFSNFSNISTSSQQQQQDNNFPSLSTMNLTPVTSTNDNNLWMQQMPQQYGGPRTPRIPTATITGQAAMSPMQGADQSMQQSQVMVPLLPGALTYSAVLISSSSLQQLENRFTQQQVCGVDTRANPSIKHARVLLNTVLSVIFTREELVASIGVRHLDKLKMSATKCYVQMKCAQFGWDMLSNNAFRKTVQNKIDNTRRSLGYPNKSMPI